MLRCRRILVVLVATFVVTFLDSTVEARPGGSTFRTCGQNLALRIGRVCSGNYNSPNPSLPSRRVRRGIVDECCKSPCHDLDITQYCNTGTVERDSEEVFFIPETNYDPHHHRLPLDYHLEVVPEEPVTEATKSKMLIGRVSKDFVKPWTYTAN